MRVGLRIFGTLKDACLYIIVKPATIIVSVAETSFKIALTLCQKWLTICSQKAQTFSSDHTILFNFHQHVFRVSIK